MSRSLGSLGLGLGCLGGEPGSEEACRWGHGTQSRQPLPATKGRVSREKIYEKKIF